MSCEYRRRKFLGLLVSGSAAGGILPGELNGRVASLERIYQQAYDAAGALSASGGEVAPSTPGQDSKRAQENRRKTRLLFAHMLKLGVPLPVHSSSGLPKPEAQAGYAALWDAVKSRIESEHIAPSTPPAPPTLPTSLASSVPVTSATPSMPPAPPIPPMLPHDHRAHAAHAAHSRLKAHCVPDDARAPGGSSAEKGERGDQGDKGEWEHGARTEAGGWAVPWLPETAEPAYGPDGYSKEGYSRKGLDRHGRDRSGFDAAGFNAQGFDRQGFDASGRDRQGYDRDGYDASGFNRHGFNKDGWDKQGFDWMGFDHAGFSRAGYNRHGYNRAGSDEQGYDRAGYNRHGYNRRGYNRQGLNAGGRDRFGYDASGYASGYNKQGYDASGYDKDGYNPDAYSRDGFDRQGYNRSGRDRAGSLHPWWVPDAEGYYGDGCDLYGFDRDGYDPDGRDRWGFNREGLNEASRDREGYNREGYSAAYLDREQYNQAGYSGQGYDRLGYSAQRLGNSSTGHAGFSVTGYDKDGYNEQGVDRWGRDRSNREHKTKRQYKALPYNKSGFDKDGYDRWGFNRDTGLTRDGRNYAGWVYDPDTKTCCDPSDPARRMPHSFFLDGRGVQWNRPNWQTRASWDPSVLPARDTRAGMSWEAYSAAYAGQHASYPGSPAGWGTRSQDAVKRSYQARLHPSPNVEQRWQRSEGGRARFDHDAAVAGVMSRCPHCGRFTGYAAHDCPQFGDRRVTVFRSGLARREGQADYLRPGDDYSDKGLHADTHVTLDGCYATPGAYGPFANGYSDAGPRPADGAEERDPAYMNGGYNRYGYDADDFDRQGRDRRGRDADGYNRAGFDLLGRDRDGYDRHGYDASGRNRAGEKSPRSLSDLAADYSAPGMEGDILMNEGVRRLYSQVATSLAGKPRQVVLREGGGFATDMQGTIYLDPYPLGREVPPVCNAAVVMEGLQHEMGHELETPYDTFRRILEIAGSPEPAYGLDRGRGILKNVYNIIEDGRMERIISRLPGVAEYLAVGCRLQPRWDERVGEGVPLSHEVQGALLYEALPYYRLRPEVLSAMTPESRAVFEELRPIVHKGVLGDAEDAFAASLEIARRLQERGLCEPDSGASVPEPAFFSGARHAQHARQGASGASGASGAQSMNGGEGGDGIDGMEGTAPEAGSGPAGRAGEGGEAGKEKNGSGEHSNSGTAAAQVPGGAENAGTGPRAEPSAEPGGARSEPQPQNGEDARPVFSSLPSKADQRPGTARKEGASAASGGSGGIRASESSAPSTAGSIASGSGSGSEHGEEGDPLAPFSRDQVRQALENLERDLCGAVESDIRRQSRVEVLGRNLHRPISARTNAEQVYRDSQGRVRSADVQFPVLPAGDAGVAKLQRRRAEHRQVARQLARYLESVRDVAEETANFQRSGKLDRHRFGAAMKNAPDVYKRRVDVESTGFALSIAVDMSGSMSKEMRSGALCDAAVVLSDSCEEMSMAYEVRAFSSRSYQYKAMDDPSFSIERAAMLVSGEGGGTNMSQTAGLAATSLLARPERNKLFVSLTDGDLGDHDACVRQMEQARRDGVLTFGVFLSRGGYVNRDRMDQIYGKANWAAIESIQDMPRAVGQRIALLMRRAR